MNTAKPHVVAITGHRPENIPDEAWTRQAMQDALQEMKATKIIQGSAAGVDLWSTAAAWKLGIPFVSARPWATHSAGRKYEQAYEWMLNNSEEVVNVSSATSYPGVSIYNTRNIYMINNADTVLAVWNGLVYGGTYHAVQYSLEQGKKIYRINPKKQTVEGWIN